MLDMQQDLVYLKICSWGYSCSIDNSKPKDTNIIKMTKKVIRYIEPNPEIIKELSKRFTDLVDNYSKSMY